MSEDGAAPRLPAVIGTRYVPIRVIGRGGMGMVYEVEHNRTGEHLALKVLLSTVDSSAGALERFKREARASARIKSEHVVRVTDADVAPELDGAPFLVMELLEGMDIEKAADELRPTPATVVGWLRQVARAVDKAHRLGIVHRDLKPENLFLADVEDREPIVKVLDFGIAKMAQEGAGATGSGQVLGTPKYMAPEQAAGNARVTAATDLYAIGLIAYRLVMEESYHRDDNVMSILASLLHGQLQPPSARNPRFGAAFDGWFAKACHREPEARFASASAEVEALAEALGLPALPIEPPRDQSAPVDAPAADVTPTLGLRPRLAPAPPAPAGSRTRVLVLAAVGVTAVAVAGLLSYQGSRADRPLEAPPLVATPAAAPVPAITPPPAVAPTVAPPELPDQPRAEVRSITAPQPRPTGKGRKTVRTPVHASGVGGEGAEPPVAPDADPFRDQK